MRSQITLSSRRVSLQKDWGRKLKASDPNSVGPTGLEPMTFWV